MGFLVMDLKAWEKVAYGVAVGWGLAKVVEGLAWTHQWSLCTSE